jgi:DNA transformation protein
MGELAKLPNIGPDTERLLNAVGIKSPEQLKIEGAKGAWLKIYAIDSSACIQRLYSLQGAVSGVNKKMLDGGVKKELKDFYNGVKGKCL